MSKLIDEAGLALAGKFLRVNGMDSIAARKNQWRLELEKAYGARHTGQSLNVQAASIGESQTKVAGESFLQQTQMAPAAARDGSVPRGTMSGSTHMDPRALAIRRETTAAEADLDLRLANVIRAANMRQTDPGATPQDEAAEARLQTELPAAGHKEMQLTPPLRIAWKEGAAYVYVLAGAVDPAQMDVTIRHIRQWFERSGLRVSAIMIGGVEKWVAETDVQGSTTTAPEQGALALNRIY